MPGNRKASLTITSYNIMTFDYQSLIDDAMLNVVKKILLEVRDKGLQGDQSFYVSFLTKFPGVLLSKKVKDKHPKEITIVLQHQFRDLTVLEDKFIVNISFGGAHENVEVPFQALTSFLDPVSNFGFRFIPKKTPLKTTALPKHYPTKAEILPSGSKFTNRKITVTHNTGTVIAMDQFLKKRDEKNNK